MSDHETFRLDIPADHRYLGLVGAQIAALLGRAPNMPGAEELSYGLQLAVHEICANVVDHAYRRGPGRIAVTMMLAARPRRIVVEVRDSGAAFDPATVPPPDLDQAHEGGYGLVIVRSLMDEVTYEPLPEGNCWRLVKLLEG